MCHRLPQLFPYVAFMIRDELEMTSDTQAIGYYAGPFLDCQ